MARHLVTVSCRPPPPLSSRAGVRGTGRATLPGAEGAGAGGGAAWAGPRAHLVPQLRPPGPHPVLGQQRHGHERVRKACELRGRPGVPTLPPHTALLAPTGGRPRPWLWPAGRCRSRSAGRSREGVTAGRVQGAGAQRTGLRKRLQRRCLARPFPRPAGFMSFDKTRVHKTVPSSKDSPSLSKLRALAASSLQPRGRAGVTAEETPLPLPSGAAPTEARPPGPASPRGACRKDLVSPGTTAARSLSPLSSRALTHPPSETVARTPRFLVSDPPATCLTTHPTARHRHEAPGCREGNVHTLESKLGSRPPRGAAPPAWWKPLFPEALTLHPQFGAATGEARSGSGGQK